MGARTGTRRRGGRGRHSAAADELTETARRRLHAALGTEVPTVGGWVPQPPPSAPAGPAGSQAPGRRWLAGLRDRLPVGVQAVAVAPTGRALVGLVLVVAVAVATTGATAWVARPQEQRPPGRAEVLGEPIATVGAEGPVTVGAAAGDAAGSESEPSPASAGSAAAVVLVHVAGAVRRPGLVELPPGARVAEALEAAGGVTRSGNPASVNLARPVVDGEQVVVARRGAAVAPLPFATSPGAGTGPGGTGPIDLNTATMEQLDGLPGIGPVLAERILDWRTANGRFSVVDELGEVSGIGEATLADLRPLVTV